MNEQRARIKDRIRKLLALSKSPYEAEAASALAKVRGPVKEATRSGNKKPLPHGHSLLSH